MRHHIGVRVGIAVLIWATSGYAGENLIQDPGFERYHYDS